MRLLLAMITAGLLLAAPAGAADCEKTWSNAAGGDWNSNANWSDGDGDPNNNVPGGDDHACIQLPGNYTVTNSNNATAGEGLIVGDNLTANGSPTLRITSLTEAGNPVGLSLTTGVATVFADGTLELAADGANPGQSSLSVGTLTNLGIVRTVPGPGTSEDKRDLSGSYVNESTGRFEIGKTTLPSNTLSFINRGSITVADGATFNISHPGSGPTVTMETGSLTTTGSGVLKISNGLLNYLGGGAPGNPIQLCGAALNASGSGIANIDFVSEAGCAGGRLVGDIGNNKIVRGVSGAGTNTITIDAPITNQGTLVLTGPSDSQLIGAKLTNEGTLRTEPGGPRLVQVEVATTGTVEIQAATRSTLSPSTWTNGGQFSLGAALDLGPAVFNQTTGTLFGGGALKVKTLTQSAGTVAPAGTLTVIGDYTQTGGALSVDLGSAEKLAVTGKASLGARLIVAGDTATPLQVLTAGAVSGKFSSVTDPYKAQYSATDVKVARGSGSSGGDGPETTVTKKPKRKGTKRRVRFRFTSDDPAATFQCKLDKGAYKACKSGIRVKVKRGRHTFRVRARDADGNVDPTPAKVKFRVRRRR